MACWCYGFTTARYHASMAEVMGARGGISWPVMMGVRAEFEGSAGTAWKSNASWGTGWTSRMHELERVETS